MKTNFLFLITLLVTISCSQTNRKVENLRSFAKVYGYVRWFYPGDEAAKVNWDRFAVLGAQKVENARNERELKNILLELFRPIAPAIQIEDKANTVNFDYKTLVPRDSSQLRPVAWKHYGVGLGEQNTIYQSIRSNRQLSSSQRHCLAEFISSEDELVKFRNKEVKLVISAKLNEFSEGLVDLNLCSFKDAKKLKDYTDLSKNASSFSLSQKWSDFEKTVKITDDCKLLVVSIEVDQLFAFSVSNVRLLVNENGNWRLVKTLAPEIDENGWNTNKFIFNCIGDSFDNGRRALKITPAESNIPAAGTIITKDIGNNLVVKMPIVLYGTKNQTFPVADSIKLRPMQQLVGQTQTNIENPSVKLANLIITWNVLQHFYPYFDVVKVDWEKELRTTLRKFYETKNETDYYKLLCRLIAKLDDGHGIILNSKIEQWGLPIAVDWIENNIVITETETGSDQFLRGDIIVNIDGKRAIDELHNQESLISGSPQLRRYRALNLFGSDFEKTEAKITILRNGRKISINAQRTLKSYLSYNPLVYYKINAKPNISDNILYINGNFNYDSDKDDLFKAKRILFSSAPLSKILPHLIKEPVWSPNWNVPVSIFPDREKVQFDTSRWRVLPKAPYIGAKCVFITEPYNVSADETMLGIVDFYKLGKLVGNTTAGTNGNVNIISLMGGYTIWFTGMKALKHDGSQHHLIGFTPDYPVSRTTSAVKAGRDEVLEKAIEILRKEE